MRSLGAYFTTRASLFAAIAVLALTLSACGREDIADIVGDEAPVAKTYVGLENVEQVEVWIKNACARHTDGSITCWGAKDQTISRPPDGTFTDMALGGDSCAIKKDDRKLRCWGASVEYDDELQAVLDDEFLAIEGQSTETSQCGIRADRSIACWGSDRPPPAGKFIQIAAGALDFCALRVDRTVACWGPGIRGDAMESTRDEHYDEIVSAGYFVCGIQDDHVGACWPHLLQQEVLGPLLDSTATAFSGQFAEFCAIGDDKGIVCWNRAGDAIASPTRGEYLSIDSANEYLCAVTTRKQVACWGDNEDGRADPARAPSG